MGYSVEVTEKAKKGLKSLDPSIRNEVLLYLSRLPQDPRSVGHALSYGLKEFWRYRIRDLRILCDIDDSRLIVLVVEVGRRDKVYKSRK